MQQKISLVLGYVLSLSLKTKNAHIFSMHTSHRNASEHLKWILRSDSLHRVSDKAWRSHLASELSMPAAFQFRLAPSCLFIHWEVLLLSSFLVSFDAGKEGGLEDSRYLGR